MRGYKRTANPNLRLEFGLEHIVSCAYTPMRHSVPRRLRLGCLPRAPDTSPHRSPTVSLDCCKTAYARRSAPVDPPRGSQK